MQNPCFKTITIAMIISTLSFFRVAYAEHVFLHDGGIVTGSIVNDAARSITVRTADGNLKVITRNTIRRIQYSRLSLGKIHVQMRDGSNFEAYMVDEDQQHYVFRKALYSPAEMKVKRVDVLFIAERNPSGLKGEPGTDRMALSWYPPYNPIQHYLLYAKAKNEKNFRPPVKVTSVSHVLKKLKSNTGYVFRVTAVDDAGDESLPSNELTVATKNIPPGRPLKLAVTEKALKGGRGPVPVLKWEPSKDPDGTVKEYRVYRNGGSKPVLLGKTGMSFFGIPVGIDTKDIAVRALDDRGAESEDAVLGGMRNYAVLAGARYLHPVGDFGTLFDRGYGGMVSCMEFGRLARDVGIGAEVGFFYFNGKADNVQYSTMIPLMGSARYRFNIVSWFSIEPGLSVGGTYNTVRRDKNGVVTGAGTGYTDETKLELMCAGGVALVFTAGKALRFHVSADYYGIVESSLMSFISIGAGITMTF